MCRLWIIDSIGQVRTKTETILGRPVRNGLASLTGRRLQKWLLPGVVLLRTIPFWMPRRDTRLYIEAGGCCGLCYGPGKARTRLPTV